MTCQASAREADSENSRLVARGSYVTRTAFPATSERMRMVDRLPIERMAEKIREAEAVVTHAGVGSVLLCYLLGVVPIVFPRRAELGEHVDDHQMEFARRMEREGELVAAYDGEDLLRAIAEYPERLARTRRPAPGNGTRLTDYLEGWLNGEGCGRRTPGSARD